MVNYRSEYDVVDVSGASVKKNKSEEDSTHDFNESLFENSTEQLWVD